MNNTSEKTVQYDRRFALGVKTFDQITINIFIYAIVGVFTASVNIQSKIVALGKCVNGYMGLGQQI